MEQVSALHSFAWLNTILPEARTTFYLSLHQAMGVWLVCAHLLATAPSAARSTGVQGGVRAPVFQPWGMDPGGELPTSFCCFEEHGRGYAAALLGANLINLPRRSFATSVRATRGAGLVLFRLQLWLSLQHPPPPPR